jgi:steroid delta-isomerase-like uncharacterized protein
MMNEAPCAVVRRYAEEVWNQRYVEVADELFRPGHVYHDPFARGFSPGPEGVRQHLALYLGAFPDGRVMIEDLACCTERGVARWLFTGTQTGPLRGVPPTGRRVQTPGIHLFRFVGGQIAETWSAWDSLGMVSQLGLVAPFAPVPAAT